MNTFYQVDRRARAGVGAPAGGHYTAMMHVPAPPARSVTGKISAHHKPWQVAGLPAVMLVLCLSGCASLGYYAQSVSGQAAILVKRKPLSVVIADPATPEVVRDRLLTVTRILAFARDNMHLPDNGSYRTYVDLGRRFALWNVFAAPALSLEPVRWCYLVVGCLDYRGYFHEADARDFARTLRDRDLDVYLGGVVAYSTLGWFRDPVFNTMLREDDTGLARLLFHELAHQALYIQGDTEFNEAFADAVSLIATRRWLNDSQPGSVPDFESALQRENAFYRIVLDAKTRLEAVFKSEVSAGEKRARKKLILDELQEQYRALRRQWGTDDFDAWFDGGVNNAKLVAVSTYQALVPAFLKLFRSTDNNVDLFYALVRRMENCNHQARRRWLTSGSRPDDCSAAD